LKRGKEKSRRRDCASHIEEGEKKEWVVFNVRGALRAATGYRDDLACLTSNPAIHLIQPVCGAIGAMVGVAAGL
jgi:hypothetical protein